MTKWLAIFLVVGMASAFALEDTPRNREKEADRYLTVVPTRDLMADMTTKMAKHMPEGQREMFVKLMTRSLDMDTIYKAQRSAMVKVFTADELAALSDFYGSPVGKSAMGKMGDYMTELMPVLMAAMAKAQKDVVNEMSQQPKD